MLVVFFLKISSECSDIQVAIDIIILPNRHLKGILSAKCLLWSMCVASSKRRKHHYICYVVSILSNSWYDFDWKLHSEIGIASLFSWSDNSCRYINPKGKCWNLVILKWMKQKLRNQNKTDNTYQDLLSNDFWRHIK